MAAGDGVSLPTTLAQMGSVAKTQAKGQQAATQTTPFADQVKQNEDLKVQRVRETTEAQQQAVDPEGGNTDKRKRRRLKRSRKQLADAEAEDPTETECSDEEQPDKEQLGVLIDMRV
jgi:sensor c-di-GMP phosphodiesterase-like protein